MSELVVEGLQVQAGGHLVLRGVDMRVASGEVHAIMGPNGSGKSTLAHAIMGRPGFEVVSGSITLDGVDLIGLPAWQRAHAGLFCSMQYPTEVPGVGLLDMLAEAVSAGGGDPAEVSERVAVEAEQVGFEPGLLSRSLNEDLSGGEMKRSEAVQLGVLRPRIAILDELDSGLDVDALTTVSHRIEQATHTEQLGVLAITHFSRLLSVLRADVVHVLVDGTIRESGGSDLATRLEETGYDPWIDKRTESTVSITSHAQDGAQEDPFAF